MSPPSSWPASRQGLPADPVDFRIGTVVDLGYYSSAGTCSVQIVAVTFDDATFAEATGPQTLDLTERAATQHFAAAPIDKTLEIGDIVGCCAFESQWYVVEKYGPCTGTPPTECPCGTGASFSVTLSGITGGCSGMNGTWTLSYVSGDADSCLWTGTAGEYGLALQFLFTEDVVFFQVGLGATVVTYSRSLAGFSCGGSNTFSLFSNELGCTGLPSTLTVMGS